MNATCVYHTTEGKVSVQIDSDRVPFTSNIFYVVTVMKNGEKVKLQRRTLNDAIKAAKHYSK